LVRGVDTLHGPISKSESSTESSRDRLLAAAVELFAERGFERTSMRDLAGRTGMSLAGLYHHFASKERLLYALQVEAFERLFASLERMPADAPPATRLRFLITNHLEFFTSHITEMKVLSHELETLRGEPGRKIGAMRAEYYRRCRDVVAELLAAEGRTDLDSRVTTMAVFGMINWIYRWYGSVPGMQAQALAEQMCGIVLSGILARGGAAENRSR
jgi:AcrR family transcriptional regulator